MRLLTVGRIGVARVAEGRRGRVGEVCGGCLRAIVIAASYAVRVTLLVMRRHVDYVRVTTMSCLRQD
ncbi:hypothetical protein J116_000565 [Streptomyces thermolilacinus SPC6]|uniref:Uncharacterized protein n=1 Tax=Streptomyces thermolilacinus SPC6 TaxID=1306406 RepID=A0A1D3DLK3_9ACTN|nr:hypothetical protein J116_000565 [Streptomyces thermolilacinus SPC6]